MNPFKGNVELLKESCRYDFHKMGTFLLDKRRRPNLTLFWQNLVNSFQEALNSLFCLLDFAKTVLNWTNLTLFWQNLVNSFQKTLNILILLLDFAKTVLNWTLSFQIPSIKTK